MKKLFISRALKSNSKFHELKTLGWEIVDTSLIEFEEIKFNSVPQTDWIFFYSQRGIEHFFNQQEHDLSNQYAVFGSASAKTFFKITGASPKYTGNGKANLIATTFLNFEKGKSILFVKSKRSLDSLKKLLEKEMTCIDLEVYDSKIKTDIKIPFCHILAFTSPLNVKSYFQKYKIDQTQNIYCIGRTTADYLKQHYNLDSSWCRVPSENNLLQLIKSSMAL